MSKFVIYHNPRCSKSRQVLEILRDKGIEPEIIEYLKTPITPIELENLLCLLGMEPRQLMRTKEAEYKENNLTNPELSQSALINAMAKYPKLIERPIVVCEDKAVVGRPPENVLNLLA